MLFAACGWWPKRLFNLRSFLDDADVAFGGSEDSIVLCEE
jgi:hypothetical protein